MSHCYDARLTTLPDQPTLRAATHKQLVEHHHNLEQINAEQIASRFATNPHDDDAEGFYESACHGMLVQRTSGSNAPWSGPGSTNTR